MKSQQLEGYNSINKLGLTLHVQTECRMFKCRMMKTKMALYSYNSVDKIKIRQHGFLGEIL